MLLLKYVNMTIFFISTNISKKKKLSSFNKFIIRIVVIIGILYIFICYLFLDNCSSLYPRLTVLAEEVVAKQLVQLLLSRFVLLEASAAMSIVRNILVPKRG